MKVIDDDDERYGAVHNKAKIAHFDPLWLSHMTLYNKN